MKVVFTFSNDDEYESSIILSGFSCTEVLFNRLQAADGSLSFSIPFSTSFCTKMTADINNDVLAVVYDDNDEVYATGYVKKEVGYEQRYRNKPIRIVVVSPSYMLDQTLSEGYVLENKTIAYIVDWLLIQAGITDIGNLSSMTDIVPVFIFNAGDNIKEVLKELCFEYSKTFYFDKDGVFQIADLFKSWTTASQTFTRANISDSIDVTVKESDANCIRGSWTPVSYVENTLVFEDRQGAAGNNDCMIPIAANSWFADKEDNFLTCDSELGKIIYIKSISENNISAETGVSLTLDLQDRVNLDQLHFKAQNTTGSVKYITKMNVKADAYIQKETRTEVTTYGNKEKELTLRYIQDSTVAQTFVKKLADYYAYTGYTLVFASTIDCDLGDFVTVVADGIGNFNCRIIKKTRTLTSGLIRYECENIGEFTPSAIEVSYAEPQPVNTKGYQDYKFAVGAFNLTDTQARALDWYDAPPATTAQAPCLYMATKWIGG